MTSRLLTFAEAADAAHVHPVFIRAPFKAKRLRVHPTWRGVRIDRDELMSAIAEWRRERNARSNVASSTLSETSA